MCKTFALHGSQWDAISPPLLCILLPQSTYVISNTEVPRPSTAVQPRSHARSTIRAASERRHLETSLTRAPAAPAAEGGAGESAGTRSCAARMPHSSQAICAPPPTCDARFSTACVAALCNFSDDESSPRASSNKRVAIAESRLGAALKAARANRMAGCDREIRSVWRAAERVLAESSVPASKRASAVRSGMLRTPLLPEHAASTDDKVAIARSLPGPAAAGSNFLFFEGSNRT